MSAHLNLRRVMALLLAALLLCGSAIVSSPRASAVTQAQINALKDDAAALRQEKNALQSKINAISNDISETTNKKVLLDEKIALLSEEIENAEAQIALYEDLIAQTEAELADAEAREAAQYELFCERVRAMEERGEISYWSVLFKASSFTDMLSRLDIINEIMDSDQKVIDDLKALQVEIAAKKAELEEQKRAEEEAKAELEEKQAELDRERAEANALIAQLQASRSEYQEDMDDLSAEENQVQARIMELTAQLAAEEEARRKREEAERAAAAAAAAAARNNSSSSSSSSASGTSGGFSWPVGSHYITSTFGGRASPGGIGSTNHKGIDIGRVGYTTAIHPAKSGTVIISEYSSSYGNYVVVSHGGGVTTLYAHMSSRSVEEGQSVTTSSTLGITGSTGHSTGPHLHFEISINGNRVNPLNYLGGYTLAG